VYRDNPTHKTPRIRRGLIPALALSFCAFVGVVSPSVARADTQVGASLDNAEVRDARDLPAQIPGFGEKVLLILYTDPDVADQNDPFADLVKASDLDKAYYQSIGIANMEDAPAKPNWIIRAIVRSKIKKYNVTILTDPKRLLPHAWNLGECNDKSVVLVIGKDKKLKYFKKGHISTEKGASGQSEADQVLELLKKTIAEAHG